MRISGFRGFEFRVSGIEGLGFRDLFRGFEFRFSGMRD